MWVGQTEFVKARSSLYTGHRYPMKIINHEPQDMWVPNRSSVRGDLGKFVDQSTEPVVASEAKW